MEKKQKQPSPLKLIKEVHTVNQQVKKQWW